ncbi:ADP-ribose pyrophosphatase YjhB, NUDIX family [Blastococcus aggregatus]|uniref:ADP-ribose pyrophosphatase YjhB, NUDIX family n=1 Tax=Blastococcus aggregatus TaxID=38502 RepID=A0A285V7E7_9ACTN|nr:CoA pyrophosphatase [Blastococcus aggregatus]SOC49933.1 ADP-ribose pyrophosphatase YjhB, NUDIX family [Blastococcus aggregatus]
MAALDRDVVAERIGGFPRVAVERPELKQAAVALCVTVADAVPTLVITRRAAGLRAHAGQWALPGGRLDAGEGPVEGALRELHEEIGLDLAGSAVLGLLDDYVTRSGYVMTPVVCWAGPVDGFAGSEPEVAAVFEVPLADLDVDPVFESIPESDGPVIKLPLLGGFVHAPTAAVVHQFCRIACRGEVERVAGYEQPVFAWR